MDAITESLAKQVSDLTARNAANLRIMKRAEQRIVQLCETANTLSNKLGLGDKVRAEHFADELRAALAAKATK